MLDYRKIMPAIFKDPWTYTILILAGLAVAIPPLSYEWAGVRGGGKGLSLMMMLFVLLGALSARIGFYLYRKYQLIVDTPTASIGSASMGRAEFEGRVECNDPLESPLGHDCVYYRVTVLHHDGDDPSIIASEERLTNFQLTDGTGAARIWSSDEPSMRTSQTDEQEASSLSELPDEYERAVGSLVDGYEREDGEWVQVGMFGPQPDRMHTVTIHRLDVGTDAYAIGRAAEPRDGADCDLKRDEATGTFIVANEPEDEVATRYGSSASFLIALGVVLMIFGYAGLLHLLTPLL